MSKPAPETERVAKRLARYLEWWQDFWLGYVFTLSPPQVHILQMRACGRSAMTANVSSESR